LVVKFVDPCDARQPANALPGISWRPVIRLDIGVVEKRRPLSTSEGIADVVWHGRFFRSLQFDPSRSVYVKRAFD
jgi:hypothetical protein